MNEAIGLILAWMIGLALGGLFFGGLWWTVHRLAASNQPAMLFLVSFLLRMAVVISGFLLVGRGDWKRLAICLVGFVMARIVLIRLTRVPLEAHHAH
jgi:F1F0 ATPase subunit 2